MGRKPKLQKLTEDMASEYWDIRHFAGECLVPEEDGRVLMRDAFEAYKKWKWKCRKESSGVKDLSLVSFGRLFPEHYKRASTRVDGYCGVAIFEVKIDRATLKAPTKDGRVEENDSAIDRSGAY